MTPGFSNPKRDLFLRPGPQEKKAFTESGILVKVLGTAQDGGLPEIGCYCPNCRRAREDPQFARLISSLALIDFEERKFFLVDATPDIRAQASLLHERLGWDLEKSTRTRLPDAVILSHAHIGHYTGLMFYGYESISAQGVPVYGTESMRRFLAANGPWSQLVRLGNISVRPLFSGKAMMLTSNLTVLPFSVPHRDEYTDTLGFIFSGRKRKLLYIPDIQSWEAWDESIRNLIVRVDIALLDGTFYSA